MYQPRRKIFWFAITSRIVILILQFIFNLICPDHDADAFKAPSGNSDHIMLYDSVVKFMFSGLSRWDGQYFLHIAKHGYTYENTLAFYPLYPVLIQIVSLPIRRIFFMLSVHSCTLIAAVLLNTVCFVKSAVTLYDLSYVVLKNRNMAYKAAVLYCINPATIFFSAIYSESLFAYLTFYSMLCSIKLDPHVSLPIGLSVLTRSNGIVNIGFPVYFQLRKFYWDIGKNAKLSLKSICQLILQMATLRSLCLICNTIIISLAPFILLQIYNYMTFCIPNGNKAYIPEHIVNYGIANNLVLPGTDRAEWCQFKLPVAYSYIQKKYWNVGFLKYYEIKQIPNFVLAFPILCIVINCAKEYIQEHKNYFCKLGFTKDGGSTIQCDSGKYPAEMLVFVIHGLFLTILCTLFVHIQVSTRLISSASPLSYWYCALSMSCTPDEGHDNDLYENYENLSSKWKVYLLRNKNYVFKDKLILSYFLGYALIGCFMFPNFLPWT